MSVSLVGQGSGLLAGSHQVVGQHCELADQAGAVSIRAGPLRTDRAPISRYGHNSKRAQLASAGKAQVLLQDADHRGRFGIHGLGHDRSQRVDASLSLALNLAHLRDPPGGSASAIAIFEQS